VLLYVQLLGWCLIARRQLYFLCEMLAMQNPLHIRDMFDLDHRGVHKANRSYLSQRYAMRIQVALVGKAFVFFCPYWMFGFL
jgi:hypothetical protein